MLSKESQTQDYTLHVFFTQSFREVIMLINIRTLVASGWEGVEWDVTPGKFVGSCSIS